MIFERVRFKNFLSYGNAMTEFSLNTGNIVVVTGENGRGKSTMLEAVFFALTGKPYRDINKPQLVNTINKKDCLVELEFSFKENSYMIRRGIKPNVFEIYRNSELIDQDNHVNDYQTIIDDFLGATPNILKQTVIISNRFYKPYLEMTVGDKREFIETILSLKMFSAMTDVIKAEVSSLKQEGQFVSKDMDKIKSNIEIINDYIRKEEVKRQQSLGGLQEKIEQTNAEIFELTARMSEHSEKLIQLRDKSVELVAVLKKMPEIISAKGSLAAKISDAQGFIDFLGNSDVCVTCQQPISPEFRSQKITEREQMVSELRETQQKITERYNKLLSVQEKNEQVISAIQKLNTAINSIQAEMSSKNQQILSLQKLFNEQSTNSATDETQRKETLTNELEEASDRLRKIESDQKFRATMVKLLSEKGIKKFVLDKYIPVLNSLITDTLEVMDSKYQVIFDSEMNEKIVARGYEDLGYGSFSTGEKNRCDLALLFSFLELSRLKNNFKSNIICFDDCFGELDPAGITGLRNIFTKLKNSGYTIFILTQKESIMEMADSLINVTKNQFSKVEYVK